MIGLAFTFGSCSKKLAIIERGRLPRKKTVELTTVLDSISSRRPNFFYSKIGTDFTDTNRSVSFKTSVRMVKDSAINILITYAKIPIANSIITIDSVKIVNKREKCYISQSLDFFKDNFGFDFSFTNLEELILGLPLAYDTTQKYFQIHEPYNYVISSHKKRVLKKIDKLDKKDKLAEKLSEKDDLLIKYYISDSLKEINVIQIESPFDSTSINVEYLERNFINGFSIPKEVVIQIKSPRNFIRIHLDYDKVELNKPESLIFMIPEGYEKCD